MKRFWLTVVATFALQTIALFAQTPIPQSTPPNNQASQAENDDVVVINSDLIRIDITVTDEKGNVVTDLAVDDFEVYQDGKLQKITGFSRVNRMAQQFDQTLSNKSVKTSKDVPIQSPLGAEVNNAGRILTFVVDDGNCRASQIGMIAAREALEKFINEQMQPNDLVAVYQTRGGSSLLQQYTADKTQLMRVIRKICWLPAALSCGGGSGEIFEPARNESTLRRTGQGSFENGADRMRRQAGEDINRDAQVVGTIGVLRYVVRGLQRVGGRKTVFFLTDGLPLRTRDNTALRAQDALRDLTDLANRAAVVFNTVDVRGVLNPNEISASDDVDLTQTGATRGERRAEVRNTQNGMFFLANETGGRFYHDQNFLDVPIRRALDLEKGYYLLAYEPEGSTFKGKKFHQITVKLKRSDLNVHSRSGFVGVTDDEITPKKRTGDSELYEAIVAPLPNAGLNLRMSAFFSNTPTTGNFVRSLIYLDKNDVSYTDEPNGDKKLVFDVVAVTMNEKNEVVDEFNRTHTVRVRAEGLAVIKRNGLVYTADVPVKKIGTYTFRVAMRDASSKQIGAASQVVEVPELKKGDLFLSDLSMSGVDESGKFTLPEAVKVETAFAPPLSAATPAIRQFKPGTVLAYSYVIYNAQPDKTTNLPKLTVQTLLYRDGKLISSAQPQPAQLEKQEDSTRLKDYGYLRLNPNTQPSDYALQVIIKDLTTNQTSSQWIDFEVVN